MGWNRLIRAASAIVQVVHNLIGGYDMLKLLGIVVVGIGLMASPAAAGGLHVGDVNNHGGKGGQGGKGGNASSTAVSTAVSKSVSTAVQGQHQGQGQGQAQSYEGTQNYTGSYEGSQSIHVDGTRFDRYAPPVGAPALTSAGTGVCLGSVSIGLSGPMAGASFGITKVDKGCEQRSAAALLYQMGYRDAAVRLLMKNEDVREAMEGPKAVSAQVGELHGIAQQVLSPSTNFGAVQGN